jgi:hypothetical protein
VYLSEVIRIANTHCMMLAPVSSGSPRKQLIFDAPTSFNLVSIKSGHLAHIDLLFLWERNTLDWRSIRGETAESAVRAAANIGATAEA